MPDRVFDVDFGQVVQSASRPAGEFQPDADSFILATDNSTILEQSRGRVVLYQEIDLEVLVKENRVFAPYAVEVQRPWTAPLGFDLNPYVPTRCYEYLYVFSAPLANQEIPGTVGEFFKDLGLDSSIANRGSITAIPGGRQIPDNSQCIYAQSTVSVNNLSVAASVWNGLLTYGDPTSFPPVDPDPYAPLQCGEMQVSEVNKWGSLPEIIGPKLYCYRFIEYPSQELSASVVGPDNPIVNSDGLMQRNHSSLSIKIMCREVELSDGEYIIRAANAYNNANADDVNES